MTRERETWASVVTHVDENDDPSGELVFGRFGRRRNLRMLVGGEPERPVEVWRWGFRATLRQRDGRIYLSGLEMHPIEEGVDELMPWVLRAIRPDAIVSLTLRHLRDRHKKNVERGAANPEFFGAEVWSPRHQKQVRKAVERLDAEPPSGKRRGGRPPLGDKHFRELAHACLAMNPEGKGNVMKTLAEKYDVKPKTVARWIVRARDEGYLAKGQPGRLVFGPGPRLGGS